MAPRLSIPMKALLVGAGLTILWSSVSLVRRAARRHSDFSTFYRTAQAVRGGVAPEFYGQPDSRGGRRCIPPSGTMLHFFMPWVSYQGAAAIWSALNLGFLAFSAWCLWRIFNRLDRQRRLYRQTWWWALVLLVFMSGDSMQVGQFSLLFATCWLAYLAFDSGFVGAAMLVLPASIKLYPALLWAVPLARRRYRQLLWLAPAALLIGVLLPLPLYGARLPGMWSGFFHHTVLAGTHGRFGDMLNPVEEANQSLDNQLQRVLTDQPEFNRAYPYFPHLHLPAAWVQGLILALKLGLLLATCVAAWRLGARGAAWPRWTALVLLGLWSVTLVLLLPENKAPYITYSFPGWLPVLALLTARHRHRRLPLRWAALVALGVASQIQIMPFAVRVYGPALAVTVALWVVLVGIAWRNGGRVIHDGRDASGNHNEALPAEIAGQVRGP